MRTRPTQKAALPHDFRNCGLASSFRCGDNALRPFWRARKGFPTVTGRLARALVFIVACTGAAAFCTAADVTPPDSPAVLTKRVPPHYPAKAVERGQEGWVDLSFTVTPEGTTSAIRVIAQYPKHVFARNAVNALSKWVYRPRIENGVAVPQGNNHAVLSFALADSSSLRDSVAGIFADAWAAIEAHDWQKARQVIDQIETDESLRLFELAVVEELRGYLAFGQKDYAAATIHFDRSFELSPRLPPDQRDNMTQALVVAALRNGQYQHALEVYDAWSSASDERRALRRTMDSVRAALGAGRPVVIDPDILPDPDQ
jgi:TonB family protein